ncbi:hypothetical protein BDW60DRAFT_85785 [Aspergillus nidulans var. acristatus]
MLWWRLWSFGFIVSIGALSEVVASNWTFRPIDRIIIRRNPYSSTGFKMHTLTMGPALVHDRLSNTQARGRTLRNPTLAYEP